MTQCLCSTRRLTGTEVRRRVSSTRVCYVRMLDILLKKHRTWHPSAGTPRLQLSLCFCASQTSSRLLGCSFTQIPPWHGGFLSACFLCNALSEAETAFPFPFSCHLRGSSSLCLSYLVLGNLNPGDADTRVRRTVADWSSQVSFSQSPVWGV